MKIFLGVLLSILLSLAFAMWVGSAKAQGGTWRLTLYNNGVGTPGGSYPSFTACTAAGQTALLSGRAKRYDCIRMGNGGLPGGKKRR